MAPSWDMLGQVGVKLRPCWGPSWPNVEEHWDQVRPSGAKICQHRSQIGQHSTKMVSLKAECSMF
eukprot:1579682-Karenia_brevis.AAC.1